MNVVEEPDLSNIEGFVRSVRDAALTRQNRLLYRLIDHERKGDFLSASDSGRTASDIFDGDFEVGLVESVSRRQNIFAVAGKFKLLSVESRVMRIAPSGASAGALAVVAGPFSIDAGARLTFAFDLAARRKQISSVLALAFRLQHAFARRVTDVVVLAFATWDAIIRFGTDTVFGQRVAFGFALLVETIRPLFVGFWAFRRQWHAFFEVRSFADAFFIDAIFVHFDHFFALAVILAVGVTAAILDGDADSVFVPRLTIGTDATFGADVLTPGFTQRKRKRNGATGSLTIVVHARFVYLAWFTLEFAGVNFRPPLSDWVTFGQALVRVTSQIVADAFRLAFRFIAVTMIDDAVLNIGIDGHHGVTFFEGISFEDFAGFSSCAKSGLLARGRRRGWGAILRTPFVSESGSVRFDIALWRQEVVLLFSVKGAAETFGFIKEGTGHDNFKGHYAVPLDGDAQLGNVELNPFGTSVMIVDVLVSEFILFVTSYLVTQPNGHAWQQRDFRFSHRDCQRLGAGQSAARAYSVRYDNRHFRTLYQIV